MSYPLTHKIGAFSNCNRLVKCSIHNPYQLFRLIILYLCVNVHSCFTIFMPRKILNRFGIDTGIQQIRDVGVPELMGCYIKINAVYDLRIILLMTAQFGIYLILDWLTIYILVIGSFFCSANIYIVPYSSEL